MLYVNETTDSGQADYLNSALRRRGVDAFVATLGPDAEGRTVYGIACPATKPPAALRGLSARPGMIGVTHPSHRWLRVLVPVWGQGALRPEPPFAGQAKRLSDEPGGRHLTQAHREQRSRRGLACSRK